MITTTINQPTANITHPKSDSEVLPVSNYLKQLHLRALDAAEGYERAIELVEDNSLKAFFKENVKQRTLFALELEGHLRNLEVIPHDHPSMVAKLHRSWMVIVSKFDDKDTGLLKECLRGEKESVSEYEEALSSFQMTPDVVSTVERQRDQIRSEVFSLEQMRQGLETAVS